jgi:hypothetical protein
VSLRPRTAIMAAILHPGPGSLYARFSGRLGRLSLRAHLFQQLAAKIEAGVKNASSHWPSKKR